jgi:hypothetical protein
MYMLLYGDNQSCFRFLSLKHCTTHAWEETNRVFELQGSKNAWEKTRNKSYREAKMLLAVSKLNSKSIITLELSIAQLII